MRMEEGQIRCLRWRIAAALAAVFVLLLLIPCCLPLDILSVQGFSLSSTAWVKGYFSSLWQARSYWIGVHRDWLRQAIEAHRLPAALAVAPAGALAVLGCGLGLNPHSMTPPVHGSARWAKDEDVRKMGLTRGIFCVLGRWRHRLLMLPETLSVLCIAPPGTGKTVAVVVPSILNGDGASMIVNDVKPELFAITSGHRSRLGPVFKLEWAAGDDPGQGLVHPSWNPLSPGSLPAPGPDRDLYIDRLATILVPEPTGNADPHWSRKGRAALAGLIHYIASKCETGNVAGIPKIWRDAEPSFPLLLDWMTEAMLTASEDAQRAAALDPQAMAGGDPLRDVLMAAAQEARDLGYAHRAVLELTQLANTPDRERGSILSTMDAGLAIFKNEAVRQRTSRSDFSFADLRGMKDPVTGRFRPVSVYLCVNQQDARALGVITGLFVLRAYLHQLSDSGPPRPAPC